MLISRVTTNGVETAYPGMLQYVFATVAALASYSDTAGNSATVRYPVAKYFPGPPRQGGPGTPGNGFPVAAGPNGQVVVTFTFWRPQRRSTPGDPGKGEWIDIGGLTYLFYTWWGSAPLLPAGLLLHERQEPVPAPAERPRPGHERPTRRRTHRSRFRSTLRPGPTHSTFTVNLTQCLASRGVAFNPGDELGLQLTARASNTKPDHAIQAFSLQRR